MESTSGENDMIEPAQADMTAMETDSSPALDVPPEPLADSSTKESLVRREPGGNHDHGIRCRRGSHGFIHCRRGRRGSWSEPNEESSVDIEFDEPTTSSSVDDNKNEPMKPA